MEKLSFKQYLDSKEQLLKVIDRTPTTLIEYQVKKYCSITTGSVDSPVVLSLRPSSRIIVEWIYTDVYNPTPRTITIKDVSSSNYELNLSTLKLKKFLSRHTTQITKELI